VRPAGEPDDPFDLHRFVEAQDRAGTYDAALEELGQGAKGTHWMWFVFPQVAGLGASATAVRYAIHSLDEADAYLGHPVLGPRLEAACGLVLAAPSGHAEAIFGALDARKLRSSMTLFHRAAPAVRLFAAVLEHCFDGHPDPLTDQLLGITGSPPGR
jgi:uncharacterized protein (DUF1810 family)